MQTLAELVGRSADRLLSIIVPTATAHASVQSTRVYCYCKRDIDNYRYQWFKYCNENGTCSACYQQSTQC